MIIVKAKHAMNLKKLYLCNMNGNIYSIKNSLRLSSIAKRLFNFHEGNIPPSVIKHALAEGIKGNGYFMKIKLGIVIKSEDVIIEAAESNRTDLHNIFLERLEKIISVDA